MISTASTRSIISVWAAQADEAIAGQTAVRPPSAATVAPVT
jgi:hypothetical protein